MNDILTHEDLQNLSKGELISLVNRGILKVMNISPYSIPYPSQMTKEDIPEYKKFAHLRGQKIGIGEASRKNNIPQPTISRWVKRGFISNLSTGPNRMILIDEAEVAYCAEIAKNRPGSGRWLFKPDGTPYIPDS